MIKNGKSTVLNGGQTLYARFPRTAGPLTMPRTTPRRSTRGLTALGIWRSPYGREPQDDPFFIDLGAFFDSVNFRAGTGAESCRRLSMLTIPTTTRLTRSGRLQRRLYCSGSPHHDANRGQPDPPCGPQASAVNIGTYGSTARHQIQVQRSAGIRTKTSAHFSR